MAKFIKGSDIKVPVTIEGRIGQDVKKMVNNNGKIYAMFTIGARTGGSDNETVWFTVFYYNMHEVEFIFDKCGYGKGDTLIVEGSLSSIIQYTDSEGRSKEALDLTVTADKVRRGQRKRSASEAAEDNQPQPAPQQTPAQTQMDTAAAPQQQEVKSFAEVRENLTEEDDFPL